MESLLPTLPKYLLLSVFTFLWKKVGVKIANMYAFNILLAC